MSVVVYPVKVRITVPSPAPWLTVEAVAPAGTTRPISRLVIPEADHGAMAPSTIALIQSGIDLDTAVPSIRRQYFELVEKYGRSKAPKQDAQGNIIEGP